MTPRWLDTEGAAELLGLKVRQFRERTSKLPGFPVPRRDGGIGRPMWRDDELMRWAEQQRQVA
jgi:hypothetical protein